MMRFWKHAIFFSFLCAGCSIGPRYQRPAAAPAPAFKGLAGNDEWKVATPSDALLKGKWWEVFGDPELNRLEELVAIDNQSVRQAEAQFQQARTLILSAHANAYPSIGASGNISDSYQAEASRHSFSTPAIVSWEPDLWGRARLSTENAVSNAQVSAALLENLRLSQQALLATNYFLLAAQDMQMAVLSNTIATYEKNMELVRNRYAGGVASRSDITLAQTQLSNARAQYTELHIARAQDENAIAVLTGRPPSSLQIASTKIAGPPPPIPVAIPSQLLERRPDIAAAERQVAAANANIGLAEAAFYPRLTLTASPGFFSSALQSLFTYAARSWSAGPTLSQTLFDFGRRGAALQNSQAPYDATVAGYRQTVLTAFQQVENDLVSLRYLAEEAGQQAQAVQAAEEALSLEMQRYRAGTSSYLNVITTQILALNAEQSAITILQRRMSAAVDLIKGLGGGWDASTLPSGDVMRSVSMADPSPAQTRNK
jgi:NodT family efflux transporter outer membrane factor (OMF) lipoprotein